MIPKNVRERYAHLFEIESKRGGDPKLKELHIAIEKKMTPMRHTLETYDKECERGILHTPAWEVKMESMRKELEKLEKEYVKANDAWRATTPPYDSDNHVGSCGCVIAGGTRVYWCGDHY